MHMHIHIELVNIFLYNCISLFIFLLFTFLHFCLQKLQHYRWPRSFPTFRFKNTLEKQAKVLKKCWKSPGISRELKSEIPVFRPILIDTVCICSGPMDHIFVNFVDHGAPGLIAFPSDVVSYYLCIEKCQCCLVKLILMWVLSLVVYFYNRKL